MKKVSLLFGIHMHQPVDNFNEAVDEAVKLCYEPFFETMLDFPEFKFSVHCSGWLLDKIRKSYPKLFSYMQTLTQQGSIEWFSGGYYEPVLSSISSKDRRAQIEKLNRYIKKYFCVKPRGLWLTERVWDDSLVSDLSACGIEHTLVDDYHFISNGYDKEKLSGYYLTQDNTKELQLFAISKALRYTLPFSEVDEAIEAILACKDQEGSAAVIFDDAEKFGLWPDTNRWVYEKGWLKEFITAVVKNEAIETQHYAQYKAQNRSLGLCYLDECSYEEMSEWSLQTQQAKELREIKKQYPFYPFKGGIWKNFFKKYSESNYLHKRMLQMSSSQKEFDKYQLDALYKMQTNDLFWHGVFGGIYLPSLRDNAYRYLLSIQAKRADETIHYSLKDIDEDGYDELEILTPGLSFVLSQKQGAQMIEFGVLDVAFNWQNTLMRREELYHSQLQNRASKPTELNESITTIHEREESVPKIVQNGLVFDWHAKNSFVEHFAREPFTLENFQQLSFHEVGDFANQPFALKNKKFARKGGIFVSEGIFAAKLQKKYLFQERSIRLKSSFTTEYKEKLYFAQEMNLHFAHPREVTFNEKHIGDGLSLRGITKLKIADDFTKKVIQIEMSDSCDVFATVISTLSKSERGFDTIAQEIGFIITSSFKQKLLFTLSLEVQSV